MSPVNAALADLPAKGQFLSASKVFYFKSHNFPFTRAAEAEASALVVPVPKEEARFLRVQEDLTLSALRNQQSLQVLILALEERLKGEGNEVNKDIFTHISTLKEAVLPLGQSLVRSLANDRLRRRDIQISPLVPTKVSEQLRVLPVDGESVLPTDVSTFVEERTRSQRSLDQAAAITELLKLSRKAPAPPPTQKQSANKQTDISQRGKSTTRGRARGRGRGSRGKPRGFHQPASKPAEK